MDTVNAKKRWTIIYWRVNKFLKESHVVTESASFLKINVINDILIFETPSFVLDLSSLLFYSVSGNANSMVKSFP
jgi:hypothetical protein